MIRFALDSNVLIYAELEPESAKGALAQHIVAATASRGILAVQSLLEFIAVVRRKRPQSLPSALTKVGALSAVFETAATTRLVAERAARLLRDHGFQIWDAVIFAAARDAGADVLLSEDMHDGFALDGLRIANPFAIEKDVLEALLAS